MSIRRDPIYISYDVWRGLWILSKGKDKSPDEIADDMLRNALQKEYPYLIDFQSEVNKMERAIIKQIGGQQEKCQTGNS